MSADHRSPTRESFAAASHATSAGQEVPELVRRAEHAHAALMRGDIPGYRSHLVLSEEFTLMSPFGGVSGGGERSDAWWERLGRFFRDGTRSTFELVTAVAARDVVVLAAIERTHVAVGDLGVQPWALRVTLVFRKERDEWRLVHRHADPLAEGITVAESAALAARARIP